MKKIILTAIILFVNNICYGAIYKCEIKGQISYQATSCTFEQEEVKVSKKKVANNFRECESECELKDHICRAGLSEGNYNTDGGLEVCKSEFNACNVQCSKPTKAVELKKIAESIKTKYYSKLESVRKEKVHKKEAMRKEKIRKEDIARAEGIRKEDIARAEGIRKEDIARKEKAHKESMELGYRNCLAVTKALNKGKKGDC